MTGLLVWALMPWVWWSIRRTMNEGKNPFPAFLSGYLVVTVGYVYGTMFLALVVAVCLIDALLASNRRGALKVLMIGISAGLLAITVYLPGVLSASVTVRDTWVFANDGRLIADVRGLLVSMLPTGISPTDATTTFFAPVMYLAWFLPLALWVDVSRLRRIIRPLTGLIAMLVLSTLWALGPSDMGPIRWPVRVMPFVALAATVLLTVVISGATCKPSARRLVASIA